MQAIQNYLIVALVALSTHVGLMQKKELSVALKSEKETVVNPYAKVGVITIAGPALFLKKLNAQSAN